MLYDQERDKDAKIRLKEIMNKYNIKQVEVARETGKLIKNLNFNLITGTIIKTI